MTLQEEQRKERSDFSSRSDDRVASRSPRQRRGARIWQSRYVTLGYAKRRTKEKKTLEKWKAQWKKTPPSGGFAHANKLPPTSKPRKHVYKYARELFARLVQCRTRHSFIGEYYARFVPTESTACPCGERLQTRDHILAECELYEEHREILREVDNDLDTGQLLGTEDGIKALARFLTMSGAFTKTGTPRDRERVKPTEGDDENDRGAEEWWEWRDREAEEDEYTGRVEESWEREAGGEDSAWGSSSGTGHPQDNLKLKLRCCACKHTSMPRECTRQYQRREIPAHPRWISGPPLSELPPDPAGTDRGGLEWSDLGPFMRVGRALDVEHRSLDSGGVEEAWEDLE